MTEKEYKQCISQALCPEYNALLSGFASEHVFSPEFEKQMNKLIKRRNKPYYTLVNTLGKRVAVIILAFVLVSFTTVMSVEALRKPLLDFITNIFTSHSQIISDPDESKDYPNTIQSKYGITKGVEGYEISYKAETTQRRSFEYKKEERIITFEQCTVDSFNVYTNTQDAQTEHIDINGCDAMGWFDIHNYYHLIWNNGEYVIDTMSNIGKDKLIEIAKFVQKVEK